MRVKVILNPSADKGRAIQLKSQLEAWGQEYGGFDLVLTQQPGHATELARQAVNDGYDLVVAAGGDGTIHEVVNGLVRGSAGAATLGVVPIGSGNDFAASLKLVSDPRQAVGRLFNGERRRIDLARLEDDQGRFAIVSNAVGLGFDAMISIESRTITRIHGFAMYLLATLRTIAFYYQTPYFTLRLDDKPLSQKGMLLAIGLGARVGGGFLLTPEATHFDGLLDSCLVGPVSRLTMLLLLPRVMKGTHTTHSAVQMFRNRQISLTSDLALPIHIDGEIFAYPRNNVRQVTVTVLPQALEMVF